MNWHSVDEKPEVDETGHSEVLLLWINESSKPTGWYYRGCWYVGNDFRVKPTHWCLITPPTQGEERDPAYCYYCDNLMDEPTGNACSACNARVLKDAKEPRSNEPVVLPPDLDCSAMPVVDIESALAEALERIAKELAEAKALQNDMQQRSGNWAYQPSQYSVGVVNGKIEVLSSLHQWLESLQLRIEELEAQLTALAPPKSAGPVVGEL